MNGKCIVCGAPLMDEPLFECDNMPASAQDIPDAQEVSRDRGIRLPLCQCSGCGLIQLDCEPVAYYRDVIRAGGFTSTMTQLRRSQYAHFIGTYHLEGKKFLEAGCGRGEFLNVLREFPVEVFGIENKPDLVEIARGDGLNVVCDFAGSEDHVLENGPFDAFLSFNFLEHQPDPNGMLRCLYRNLTENGMGLVTVPSVEYILENDGYYELIHDHLAYYSERSLRFLMEKNGFEVLESEMVNRDTLSVIVRKRPRVQAGMLQENYDELHEQMHAFMKERTSGGRKLAVWGASHQGFTLIPTLHLEQYVSYIIDSAPFKQGRFAPASHVPIVPPSHFHDDPVDTVLIVAPGYTQEIAGIIRRDFGEHVTIATLRSRSLELL